LRPKKANEKRTLVQSPVLDIYAAQKAFICANLAFVNRLKGLIDGAMVLLLSLSLSKTAFSQVAQTSSTKPDILKLQTMAEGGDPSAQLSLGLAYQNGRGVQQSDALAAEWYRKAALAGNAEAQNDLGIMYMNGWGVQKDKPQALRWYHMAVKQKNAHAMFNLGTAYYNGDGTEIDDARAYAWFLLAQDNGSENAKEAVQRAEKELGPTTLIVGINELAEMFFKGDELNRDPNGGVRWLRKAAEHGDVRSQLVLAGTLMDGIFVPPDYKEAREWCQAALKQKSARAAFCLGDIYRKGLGTPRDPKKALTLLRQAADSGDRDAMMEAADMLASGEAGKIERKESLIYLIRATLSGDHAAQPKAAELRAHMSDKEWKKTREEIRQRFRFFGNAGNLEAVLKSLEPSSPPK
jgi:TPR repeat protein